MFRLELNHRSLIRRRLIRIHIAHMNSRLKKRTFYSAYGVPLQKSIYLTRAYSILINHLI